MKDICASCLKYKKVAALGTFVPHDGGKAVIYWLCKDCVKEGASHREHMEAVIDGIEKHIGV